MPAQQSSSRITFAEGLLESQESSKVPIGFTTDLINWVPEPSGGLRVRGSYSKGSVTGLPATRRCLGIGMFTRYTDPAIAQVTSPVQFTVAENTNVTPVFTWGTPTQLGSLILILLAVGNSDTGLAETITTTATGWTARQALSGTGTGSGNAYGWYEKANAAAQQGDQTPINVALSTGAGGTADTLYVTAWMVEITGVASSPFDVTGTGTSTTTATANTGATAQASELLLGFGAARDTGVSTFSLSTASSGWSEYTEAGQAVGSDYQVGAIYSKVVRATGTQALAVTSSTTADRLDVRLVTYKGWNTASSPTDKIETWLSADNDTATYDIWSVDRADLAAGTFATIDTNLGSTTAGAPMAFTMGLGACWYTAASLTGIRKYDGVTASTVAGSPVGARCIAIHRERLWAAGSAALPSRLQFSQIGDGNTWSGTGTGYFDVGRDDGETIEDITPFLDGLVTGKRTSLHYLVGANTDQFQLVQLNAGGAAPGRSVLATPYGCVIAGREMVFLFDGSTVTPIGRAIERSYGVADGAFVSLSYIDGSIYIADGTAGKIFVFDLNGGTWRTEQMGDGTTESASVLYNYGDIQLLGPKTGTVGSLLNYRSFPDPTRGKDYDSLEEVFLAQTGDLPLAGARQPITPRNLYLQLRQRGGDTTESGLVVTPIFDGIDGTDTDELIGDPGVRRTVVPGFPQIGGSSVNTVGVRFAQTVPSGESSVTDIEDCFMDYIVEGPRA